MTSSERRLTDAAQQALGALQDRYGIHPDNPAVQGLADAVRAILGPGKESVAGTLKTGSGY